MCKKSACVCNKLWQRCEQCLLLQRAFLIRDPIRLMPHHWLKLLWLHCWQLLCKETGALEALQEGRKQCWWSTGRNEPEPLWNETFTLTVTHWNLSFSIKDMVSIKKSFAYRIYIYLLVYTCNTIWLLLPGHGKSGQGQNFSCCVWSCLSISAMRDSSIKKDRGVVWPLVFWQRDSTGLTLPKVWFFFSVLLTFFIV